jgi:methionyl-tRNA formyltransferase
MRIVLVTGSITSTSLIQWLLEQQLLVGVIIQNDLQNAHPQLQVWLKAQGVAAVVVEQHNLKDGLQNWFTNVKADLALVFGFSWILPQQLFDCASYGFYNIHFSLLPAYRGPAPLFWQLKNGEKQTGISIHRMSNKPDAGPVVLQLPIPIMEGEYMGFLHVRLSILTVGVVQLFIEQQAFLVDKQIIEVEASSSYQSRPTPADLRINWLTMDAKTIEHLVQASNPLYGGALCIFREQELRLVEVKRVGLYNNLTRLDKKEGLILKADDGVGIYVLCCCGEGLEIKVVNNITGTMSAGLWQVLQQVKEQEILV